MRLHSIFFDQNGKPKPYLLPLIWISKVALNALFKSLFDRYLK